MMLAEISHLGVFPTGFHSPGQKRGCVCANNAWARIAHFFAIHHVNAWRMREKCRFSFFNLRHAQLAGRLDPKISDHNE